MPFGYIGQNQTKQKVKNTGVLSSFDISLLQKKGHAGGSLELIETITPTNSTADFTSIKEDKYTVHLLTYTNVSMQAASGNQIPFIRLSNDGGSSYESSNYQSSGLYNTADGTSVKLTVRTSYGHLASHAQSSYKWGGYCYLYNLGNSSKESYGNVQAVNNYSSNSKASSLFGGFIYQVAETINALRCSVDDTNLSGTFKLYGIKEL